jgi:starvation-inducible DNA-binding protein
MKTGLKDSSITKIVDILHDVLANQHIMYQKLRNFHWNVVGKHFIALHEAFRNNVFGTYERY